MTLAEYLERNCDYLQSAIKDVPSGQDLPAVFAFVKGEEAGIVPDIWTVSSKDLAVELFTTVLKTVDADQYAIIAAAWYVELSVAESAAAATLISREGTGTVYKDRRRECYQIVVGDRETSLIAFFDVERDYKGKIRRLVRRPGPAPTGFAHGRMVDLLVEARH